MFEFNKNNTFCISLESNPERWVRMEKRFKHFGIECSRWSASTPDTVHDIFYKQLGDGARACSQSHINIWRHMESNNIPYALILEDDAMFDKDWLVKLPQPCVNWDLYMLNASEPVNPQHEWTYTCENYLTGAYIISISGAKYILERFRGCYCTSDWMTTRLQQKGNSYTYFPWLVIQEGTESTIGSSYELDHKKVVSCLNNAKYELSNYI